jgi:hypothetical protein
MLAFVLVNVGGAVSIAATATNSAIRRSMRVQTSA